MMIGRAYLNWGNWVVDCPAPGCTDARSMYHPQTGQRLTEDVCARGHHFRIEAPPADLEARIVAAVSERADDADRAWYPPGHERALLAGLPVGQTVDDLVRENEEVARFRAAQDEQRKARLAEILAEHGVRVRDDGTFEGQI